MQESAAAALVNRWLVPLSLLLLVPQSVLYLWYTAVHCGGSFATFAGVVSRHGLWPVWHSVSFTNPGVYCSIAGFSCLQLLLMRLLPGPAATGAETPSGHVPQYTDNGLRCFLVTMATFVGLAAWLRRHGASVTLLYDWYGDFLATMVPLSLGFCLLLYVKGRCRPSTADCGHSGSFVFDFYWGTELYPRVCGFDVKVFTNCRFGLTVWAIAVATFAVKSYELHGLVDGVVVTTVLQLLYLTKFFWWEAGYYRTMDIIVDRAGFYICWGCLCFVPGFYTLVSLFMVQQPQPIGWRWAAWLLLIGCASLAANYWADWQKQAARAADGHLSVWGRPAKVVRAKYSLATGRRRQAVLLASGFWGISRHFHYVPELLLALCWSAVCGAGGHLMPYLYFCFLVVLLFHRSVRDDRKCREKYGKYWQEYCRLVPYKILPFVF